ncbi:hypothetical protein JCM10449v2_003256 [Rhodotorula kratochvilovae]
MAKNTKTIKQVGTNNKDTSSGPPQFAAWRDFFATESAKLRAKNPGMKHATIQKRVSGLYRKHKEQMAEEQDGPRAAHKDKSGSGDEE